MLKDIIILTHGYMVEAVLWGLLIAAFVIGYAFGGYTRLEKLILGAITTMITFAFTSIAMGGFLS